jgi:hypothetical protein
MPYIRDTAARGLMPLAAAPDGPPNIRPARLLLISLALALGLVAACGSGSKSPPSGSTSTSSPGAASGSPSPAVAPTPAGPGSFQLQPDDSANTAFSIQFPVGWQAENVVVPGGFARRYFTTRDGARTVAITVRCAPGETIASLSKLDASLVGGTLHGQYNLAGLTSVTAGGLQGQTTDYTVPLGSTGDPNGQQQESRVLYLQGTSCAWQILLQTFATGQRQVYSALFDAVLATFQPATPGG